MQGGPVDRLEGLGPVHRAMRMPGRLRARRSPIGRGGAMISTTARACLEAVVMASFVYLNIVIWGSIL